jgi:polar amino acid transport system substrate-binding protein
MRTLRLSLAGTLLTSVVVLAAGSGASASPTTVASCRATLPSLEKHSGSLSVATDNPAYTPWFVKNTPSNAKGYEAAVVYALAKELGVSSSNVKWSTEPFDASFTPGYKSFDFDVNEISYTPARAQAVNFSVSYFDVNQSIIALKTNPIVTKHSAADLKGYLYGDQLGSTGLSFIQHQLAPTKAPRVYPTLNAALTALQAGQIDALVADTPTGQYMASSQLTDAKGKLIATQVGQFPSVGEHYGLLLQKGSAITSCVNAGLDALRANGTLAALQKKWLGIYNAVPMLKP